MAAEGDPIVEAAALIFEMRLTAESVARGLETLITHEQSSGLTAELNTLKKLIDQAADAMGALQNALSGPSGHG